MSLPGWLWLGATSVACGLLGAAPSQSPEEAKPPRNPFSVPASDYVKEPVRGFDVRVAPALLAGGDQSATGARALDALDRDLGDLLDQLPGTSHEFLRGVPIYLGVADPVAPCACYHVSEDWLRSNRFDPAKAKAVEIASALTFLKWRTAQPSMVLHELTHAYHDQVLGREHEGIRQAVARVRRDGRFDRVVRFMGDRDRHYALTNADEYFAETTEALFGVNDFYPFVRGELFAADPEGAKLVASLWGAPPPAIPSSSAAADMEPTVAAEIARLHDFFTGWFNGSLESSDEAFAAFESSLADDFEMVTPNGAVVTRASLARRLRGAHGQRKVAISTTLKSAVSLGPGLILATYEEHQAEGAEEITIVSTVVLEERPSAPGGYLWKHVHETRR